MNVLALAVAAVLSFAACGSAAPALGPQPLAWPADIADLRWLEGRWIAAEQGADCVVEHWLAEDSTLWVTIIGADGSHGAYRVYRPPSPPNAPLTLIDVSGDDIIAFRAERVSAQAIRFVRTPEADDDDDSGGRLALAYARDADGLTVTTTERDGSVRTAKLSPAAAVRETCR